ncbi:MAG: bifunctional nuclease family protein [Ignavibacteriales bacterium]|nr:bifunctional nuclease family protein [Ignavibacteriales bacterium]
MDKVQVDILGLSTSPSSAGAYALILKETNGKRKLPIIIGAFEAQSIALELEGMKPPRPLTHDLMKNIIDTFAVSLNEVFINELRDGTFYAKLSVEGVSDTQEIDSRPSDAIALAVRYGVPIFVEEGVLQEAGVVSDDEEVLEEEGEEGEKKQEKAPVKQFTTKLEQLQSSLKEAIEKEDYEKAARIRDEIRKMGLTD